MSVLFGIMPAIAYFGFIAACLTSIQDTIMDNVTTYQDLIDMDHAALIEECARLEDERLSYYMLFETDD